MFWDSAFGFECSRFRLFGWFESQHLGNLILGETDRLENGVH